MKLHPSRPLFAVASAAALVGVLHLAQATFAINGATQKHALFAFDWISLLFGAFWIASSARTRRTGAARVFRVSLVVYGFAIAICLAILVFAGGG